jgi:hypothetical protein
MHASLRPETGASILINSQCPWFFQKILETFLIPFATFGKIPFLILPNVLMISTLTDKINAVSFIRMLIWRY